MYIFMQCVYLCVFLYVYLKNKYPEKEKQRRHIVIHRTDRNTCRHAWTHMEHTFNTKTRMYKEHTCKTRAYAPRHVCAHKERYEQGKQHKTKGTDTQEPMGQKFDFP